MTKQEFIERAKINEIDDESYEIIEKVYMFHPSISNVDGKDQIAAIYNLPGGFRIIKDMIPTAIKAEELDGKIMAARSKVSEAQKELNRLIDESRAL